MLSSLCFVVLLFFFFKQKTAYEMRISDWSSDVCSSDLGIATGLSPGCECIRVPATAQRLVEIDQGERGVGGAGIEAGLAGEDAALRGQDIQVVGSAFLIAATGSMQHLLVLLIRDTQFGIAVLLSGPTAQCVVHLIPGLQRLEEGRRR